MEARWIELRQRRINMDPLVWISALSLGLLSSLHCLGMCGPLVMALPFRGSASPWFSAFSYHLTRIFIYGALGFLVGGLGLGMQLISSQQWLSIFSGILIIAFALAQFNGIGSGATSNKIGQKLTTFWSRILKKGGQWTLPISGALNGLLPCGMVYMALAASLQRSNPLFSSIYMILFGVGTLPMMLTLSLSKAIVGQHQRSRLRKLVPYLALSFGVLLLLRGMELGIPFLSPDVEARMEQGNGHMNH